MSWRAPLTSPFCLTVLLTLLLALPLTVGLAGPACADRFSPGVLELEEGSPVRARWSPPRGLEAIPVLGEPCRALFEGGSAGLLEWDCGEAGLAGRRVQVTGAAGADVVLRVRFKSGRSFHTVLPPDGLELPEQGGGVAEYLRLGVSHILVGYDHLMFILGLVLLLGVPRSRSEWRRALLVLTAFTLGHSVTLALAALDLLAVDIAWVEALIALSILLMAVEVLRDEVGLTRRYPASVSGGFGLLHGLGFASVLSDIGLPPGQVVTGLVGFNLGVEVGQVLFLIGCALALTLMERLSPGRLRWLAWPLGVSAAVMVLQRTLEA